MVPCKHLIISLMGCVFSLPVVHAATLTVNCPTDSLQAAVNAAAPGDLINVTGNCTENVDVKPDKMRVTLDGQNTATITATSAALPALQIRGKAILVRNFTVSGGSEGILVNRGSNAFIQNNVIQGNQTGIAIIDLAFAVIIGNTISQNSSSGILVSETSSARIGFNSADDAQPTPNTIQGNSVYGVYILRGSSARIYGNTISSNGQGGISVFRSSSADIASNTINGNGTQWTGGSGGNGVAVSLHSYATLGEIGSTSWTGAANTSTVNNGNAGIRCTMNSTIYGRIGTTNPLNGTVSQYGGGTTPGTFSSSCVTDIVAS